MTNIDQKLHPGEYFLERRDKSGKWEILSRDNDGEVMQTRYDYAVSMLSPGQAVRLFGPARETLFEKEVDKEPVTT